MSECAAILITGLGVVLVSWITFTNTQFTVKAEEMLKINSYCISNKGFSNVRFSTTGDRMITCADGAIFEVKGK